MTIQTRQIGIIAIHLVAWFLLIWFCNTGNLEWTPYASADDSIFWPSIYGSFFNAIIFYTNAHLLYPRRKRLRNWYILAALVLIFGLAFVEALIDAWHIGQNPHLQERLFALLPEEESLLNLPFTVTTILMSVQNTYFHIAFFFLAYAYILPLESVKNRRRYEALEREEIRAKLKYLKAQINPHFLFNGINSVYHLIGKNDNLAKDTLHRFSELLRYQLYECNEDFIPLEKEIAYLDDYIALEKIRRDEDIIIDFQLENENLNAKIAPLLLTPFIENAFKYLSDFEEKSNYVRIRLEANETQMNFHIENTFEQEIVEAKRTKSKGIGIENVKKRLALIYPKQHQLELSQTTDTFSAKLNIQLT